MKRKDYYSLRFITNHLCKLILSMILISFSWNTYAQCDKATSLTTIITNSTCLANGKIVVSSVTGGSATMAKQYALYDSSFTTVILPWQDSATFTNLESKKYRVAVRYICSSGYSEVYNQAVTVGGSYKQPIINSITIERDDQCNNGRFRVSVSNGKTPYRYALVPSLTSNEPLATAYYIRAPRSYNTFDSLSAGDYFVRVYDDCNSYTTQKVTVKKITDPYPFKDYLMGFYYYPCDSIVGRISLFETGVKKVAGTIDTISKLWVTYPNGATDTIARNISGANEIYFPAPYSVWGTYTTDKNFPDNIDGTWPKKFKFGYFDACGNIYTHTYEIVKPTIKILLTAETSKSTCDSSNYKFEISGNSGTFSHSRISDTSTSLNAFRHLSNSGARMTNQLQYSLDSGTTWTNVIPTGVYSQNFNLLNGKTQEILVKYCHDTVSIKHTVPNIPPLNAAISENTENACVGNTGFYFYAFSGIGPIKINLISGPAGFTWLEDSINIISSGVTSQTLKGGRNVLQGTYIFSFTDKCGRIIYDTLTTKYSLQNMTATYTLPCSTKSLNINLNNISVTRVNLSSTLKETVNTFTPTANGYYRALLLKEDSTKYSSTLYYSTSSSIILSSSVYDTIPIGKYIFKIWRNNGTDSNCTAIYMPFEKTSGTISLSRVFTVNSCPGTVNKGTLLAEAKGGAGGYDYSLYIGEIKAENLVAGPQKSNIFNDLNSDTTYILSVNDSCGTGTQTTISFSEATLPVTNNAAGRMPCPGDELLLRVEKLDNVSYQWFQNDTAIIGDTNNIKVISPVDTEDSGSYKVSLNVGTCIIFLSSFTLDPAKCDDPLSIENFLQLELIQLSNEVKLTWDVKTGKNIDYYIIERSNNGKNWQLLSEAIPYKHNNQSFIDYKPLNHNFYRIKVVEKNGNVYYSPIRFISLGDIANNYIKFHPNPSNDKITFDNINQTYQISIINTLGQTVLKTSISKTSNSININTLTEGIYYINLEDSNGNHIHSSKLNKI